MSTQFKSKEEILKKHIPNYTDDKHVWKVYLRGDMTDNITKLFLEAMEEYHTQFSSPIKGRSFEQILEEDYHIQLEDTRRDESIKLAANKFLIEGKEEDPTVKSDVEEKEGAILGWKTEQDFELKEAKERIHELKTWSEHFNQVFMGHKTFEVRLNDRDFKVGDTLTLIEGDLWGDYPEGKRWFPTGRKLSRRITHILHGGQFGIREGYCVMSIQ